MDDKFSITGFLIHMILYGIYLGCVLAVAIPVRELLTRGATAAYRKSKESLRTSKTVKFTGKV